MVALQKPFRFRIQAKLVTLLVESLDAGEERGIEQDGIAMGGAFRSDLGFDFLQAGIGICRREARKDAIHAGERLPRAFHRDDRFFEARLGRVLRNRLYLLQLLRHRGFERGREMLGLDAIKGRELVKQRARLQKRICRRVGSGRGFLGGRQMRQGRESPGDDRKEWVFCSRGCPSFVHSNHSHRLSGRIGRLACSFN